MNVKICATHAGLTVGEDGATHQMLEDLSLMRTLPNMTVICPSDDTQTRWVIEEVSKIEDQYILDWQEQLLQLFMKKIKNLKLAK